MPGDVFLVSVCAGADWHKHSRVRGALRVRVVRGGSRPGRRARRAVPAVPRSVRGTLTESESLRVPLTDFRGSGAALQAASPVSAPTRANTQTVHAQWLWYPR
ncbi:hypothetical protein GCM10009565_41320 [Amycolatopsis albidoflavus]